MFYKQAIYSFLSVVLGCIFLFITTVVVSDPYSLFHEKWFHKGEIYPNMRVQAYGLINSEDFDGIIMGTSMLENTSAYETSKKLNGRFINLSVSGGSHFERFIILDYALKKKKLNRIIMSIDFKFETIGKADDTFLPKLYTKDALKEKLKFYTYTDPLKCVFLQDCNFKKYDPNLPNAWKDKNFHKCRFGGYENWMKYKNKDHQIQDVIRILKSEDFMANIDVNMGKKIIDTEIQPLFRNKQVQFDLIFPPYNILWWKKLESRAKVFNIYEYLIQKIENYQNVKAYWFYDEGIPSKIELYKDLTHYHYSINSLQIDAIKNKTNIIDLKNYKQKFNDWRDKINKFNIQPYIDQIQ